MSSTSACDPSSYRKRRMTDAVTVEMACLSLGTPGWVTSNEQLLLTADAHSAAQK